MPNGRHQGPPRCRCSTRPAREHQVAGFVPSCGASSPVPPQSWRRGLRHPLRAALQALRRISRRRDDIEARHMWRRRTPAWGGGRRGLRTGWRVHALASVASSLERRLGLGVWVVGQVDGARARGTCGLYGLLRTHTQARRGRTGGPRPEAHHRSIWRERASTSRRAGSQSLRGRPSAFGTGPWRKLEVPKVHWGRNGQRRWSGAAAHSSHGDRERSGHGRGCCGPPRRKQIVRLEAAGSCSLGRSRAAACAPLRPTVQLSPPRRAGGEPTAAGSTHSSHGRPAAPGRATASLLASYRCGAEPSRRRASGGGLHVCPAM